MSARRVAVAGGLRSIAGGVVLLPQSGDGRRRAPGARPRPSCAPPGPTRSRTRIDLGADIALRDCHLGDPIRESPYPLRARRPRPHHPADLLREAAAAPGRHRLARHPRRDADPRRLRRAGSGPHLARRDPAVGLRDQAEPLRGARRRRLLDAPGDGATAATSTATSPTTTAAGSTRVAAASRSTTRC